MSFSCLHLVRSFRQKSGYILDVQIDDVESVITVKQLSPKKFILMSPPISTSGNTYIEERGTMIDVPSLIKFKDGTQQLDTYLISREGDLYNFDTWKRSMVRVPIPDSRETKIVSITYRFILGESGRLWKFDGRVLGEAIPGLRFTRLTDTYALTSDEIYVIGDEYEMNKLEKLDFPLDNFSDYLNEMILTKSGNLLDLELNVIARGVTKLLTPNFLFSDETIYASGRELVVTNSRMENRYQLDGEILSMIFTGKGLRVLCSKQAVNRKIRSLTTSD